VSASPANERGGQDGASRAMPDVVVEALWT